MDTALDYVALGGDRHRHGSKVHSHPHCGPHAHPDHGHRHDDGHHHHHDEVEWQGLHFSTALICEERPGAASIKNFNALVMLEIRFAVVSPIACAMRLDIMRPRISPSLRR
jgi:hypothetical protein